MLGVLISVDFTGVFFFFEVSQAIHHVVKALQVIGYIKSLLFCEKEASCTHRICILSELEHYCYIPEGLYRYIPHILNPEQMMFSIMVFMFTSFWKWNLVTMIILHVVMSHDKSAAFSGPYTLVSSGWNTWVVWGGRQNTMTFSALASWMRLGW